MLFRFVLTKFTMLRRAGNFLYRYLATNDPVTMACFLFSFGMYRQKMKNGMQMA